LKTCAARAFRDRNSAKNFEEGPGRPPVTGRTGPAVAGPSPSSGCARRVPSPRLRPPGKVATLWVPGCSDPVSVRAAAWMVLLDVYSGTTMGRHASTPVGNGPREGFPDGPAGFTSSQVPEVP
jgi:hypothetical protein